MTGPEVLVVGEALIDVVERGGVIHEHPGGSAANVALGLGRLGVTVELLTHLSDDSRGRTIVNHLEDSGVRVRPESIAADRTSTARALIGEDGAAHYEFDISWDFNGRELAPAAHLVHIGSLAAFLTEPELIKRYCESSGATEVSVDPNVRSALAGEHNEALRRFEALAEICTVIKLSDEDAEWLYPQRHPEAVLDNLLSAGARLAVLTRGADGIMLATPSHRIPVPAPAVRVSDTIGAGDTVMTSLLAALVRIPSARIGEKELQRLGEEAARAAAITITRAGADLPWAAELL